MSDFPPPLPVYFEDISIYLYILISLFRVGRILWGGGTVSLSSSLEAVENRLIAWWETKSH